MEYPNPFYGKKKKLNVHGWYNIKPWRKRSNRFTSNSLLIVSLSGNSANEALHWWFIGLCVLTFPLLAIFKYLLPALLQVSSSNTFWNKELSTEKTCIPCRVYLCPSTNLKDCSLFIKFPFQSYCEEYEDHGKKLLEIFFFLNLQDLPSIVLWYGFDQIISLMMS